MSARRRALDPIAVVEASYRVEADERGWLGALCRQASPTFDQGMGTFAFEYDLRGPDRMPTIVGEDIDPSVLALLETMIRSCPADELMTFCGHRINCGAGTQRFADRGLSYEGLFRRYGESHGLLDARYATVPLDDHRGIMIGGYSRAVTRMPSRTRSVWLASLCHVRLGWRLRRQAPEGWGDAVLEGDRLVHAEKSAEGRQARSALREAARRIGRARDDGGGEPADRVALWRGLVSGRWSLIDRFDSDGRRFLVAHRNPPGVVDLRRLTAREQEVARLVANGYEPQLIGYELGLAPSTVSTHLAALRRKLRVASNSELLRVLLTLLSGGADEPERSPTDGAAPAPDE